jgi:site-specific recombinase XerD
MTKARGLFEKIPGSGIWWIRYTDGAARYRRELAGSFSQAKKLLDKRRGEALQRKKFPETLRRRVVTFGELLDDTKAYIEQRYAKPKHDIGRLEIIRGWFGTQPADSLTLQEIESALERGKQENGWSASSWNHHHTLLSLTFRLAIRAGKVDRNPASGVRRMREDNSRVRFLTMDEETKLLEAVRSNPTWAPHEAELTLALSTGLRRGDMYERLIWENVDLVEKVATIPRSKNGEAVHIALNADAVRALMIFRSRSDGTGRVVRNEAGEPLKYNNFWFVPAVRAAGIKNFRWHDLRHCFASKLRQRGVPLGNIAELLGHKGLSMTRRYAHLSISNLHQAVALLESNSTTVAPEAASQEARVEYVH